MDEKLNEMLNKRKREYLASLEDLEALKFKLNQWTKDELVGALVMSFIHEAAHKR